MQHDLNPLRHVPEEELHAYLDQALSRSQCVEIEHHLAGCHACRAERDGIAALRDRTTALLVAAAPRQIRPRPFTHLSATHVERAARRARQVRTAAWAASLLAAIGLGWGLNQWSDAGGPAANQSAVAVAPIQDRPVNAALPAGNRAPLSTPTRVSAPTRLATSRVRSNPTVSPSQSNPASPDDRSGDASEPPRPATSALASIGSTSAASEPVLTGVWRTVAWTNNRAEFEEWAPRVEGVPVVQVKRRQGPQGGRPITLVTQRLDNGEMISTVEGPATEVAALLSQQPGQSASAELQDMALSSPPETAAATHQASPGSAPRTLAIFGSAPSDSLKAFMLRVK